MKAYVKPELYFESYELSQHIAACGWDLQLENRENCYATPDSMDFDNNPDVPNDRLFMADTGAGCNIDAGSNAEMYCYTNGVKDGTEDWKKVFRS